VTFRVYDVADGGVATCDVPTRDGTPGVRCTVRRSGLVLDLTLTGNPPPAWRVQLAGQPAVPAAGGATTSADPLGVVVCPAAGATSLRLQLAAGA
jgi:alpha-D-xyloside xylohydrolase